ncbi:proteasome subunit alpha type-7-like, partial [Dorcoceras hygrometricum]
FRSVRKIVNLDDHIALACAGLKPDARVLIHRARMECQSHKLTIEDPVTFEYPHTGTPSLYQTDPSGTFSAWKANATGDYAVCMTYFIGDPESRKRQFLFLPSAKVAVYHLSMIPLGCRGWWKNIEVAVMTKAHGLRQLEEDEVDAIVADIEAEKAAAEAAKKAPSTTES